MIKIVLGGVGSGKTAMAVRDLVVNRHHRKTYSNIITRSIANNVVINPGMIVKREIVNYKENKRTGDRVPVYEQKLNIDFWKNQKEPINVVLDEAHSVVNARRSMTKNNILITDWMALIRRVLGQTDAGYGELVLISQLSRRLDIIAKEMATNVQYCKMHFLKSCQRKGCGLTWREHSDLPEGLSSCPRCGEYRMKRHGFVVESWHFANMQLFEAWRDAGQPTFYRHYLVKDIEKYFGLYDTLQWDNLFSTLE